MLVLLWFAVAILIVGYEVIWVYKTVDRLHDMLCTQMTMTGEVLAKLGGVEEKINSALEEGGDTDSNSTSVETVDFSQKIDEAVEIIKGAVTEGDDFFTQLMTVAFQDLGIIKARVDKVFSRIEIAKKTRAMYYEPGRSERGKKGEFFPLSKDVITNMTAGVETMKQVDNFKKAVEEGYGQM